MVRARHEEIQKIERDFVELTQMFHDLEAMVVQQEEPIAHIDQTGEEVRENVDKANEEIKGAIDSARARNRKKWWCLLICRKCTYLHSSLLDHTNSAIQQFSSLSSLLSLLSLLSLYKRSRATGCLFLTPTHGLNSYPPPTKPPFPFVHLFIPLSLNQYCKILLGNRPEHSL